MKKTILTLLAATTLLTVTAKAQSPTPSPTAAPIVLPTPTLAPQPINVTLSAAQVQKIVTALTGAGINLPSGIQGVNFRMVTTGANAGGAWVQLRFQ